MNISEIKVMFNMKYRDWVNERKHKKKATEIAKIIVIFFGGLLVGNIYPAISNQSFGTELIMIAINAIAFSWVLVFLSIGNTFYSFNKGSYLLITGANISSMIAANSIIYTWKRNLEIGMLVAIILAANQLIIAPFYLVIYLLISAISYFNAMIFLIIFEKTVKCKSFNQLSFIFIGFLLVIAFAWTVSMYITDTLLTISLFTQYATHFLYAYLLLTVFHVLVAKFKSKNLKQAYLLGVDYLNNYRKKGNKNARYIVFSRIRNPVIYKDSILLLSNPITKFRCYLWLILLILFIYFLETKGLSFYLRWLPFSGSSPEWLVYQVSIMIPYLIFGEMILSIFNFEKGIIQWYDLTGFKVRSLVLSKILFGIIILFIPSSVTTTICMIFMELSIYQYVNILLLVFLSCASLIIINLSISLFEVNIEDFKSNSEHTLLSEQIPQTPFTFLFLAVGFLVVLFNYSMIFRSSSAEWLNYIIVFIFCLVSLLLLNVSISNFERKVVSYKR